MLKKLKNNLAFTLIEMLVVLMIISILIILVIPNISGKNQEINKKGCQALIAVVQAQVDSFYLDTGSYPEDIEHLVDEYITSDQKTCPTGEKLKINEAGIVSTKDE